MKLTTHRMLGWQTSCLRGFVVILGFVLVLAIVSAQETPSGEEEAKPAAKPATPAKTPPDKAVANSKMPDISGKWRFTKEGSKTEVEMRRVEDGSADFAFGGDVEAVRVKWSDDAQRFEGTVVTSSPKIVSKITMQFLSDQQTLRVVTSLNEQAKQHILKSRPSLSDSQLVELMNQEWTRAEKSVGKADLSADAITVSTTPTAAKPVADSKMPDISGTWRVRVAFPVNRTVDAGEMEIRRIQNGGTDFLVDQPWVTNPTRIPVQWSPARQQFEGTWREDDGPQSKITMQVPADGKPMRVVISSKKQDGDTTANQREELSNQEWTRTSLSLSTKFPAKLYGLPATTASSENDNADGTNGIRAAGVPNEAKPADQAASPNIAQVAPANQPLPTSRHPDEVVPDISGKWTYNPPDLPPEDLNRAFVAPPQMYVVSRSKQAGIDFEFLGSREPTAAPSRLKWVPGTRRFQVVPKDANAKGQTTLELSADGNTLSMQPAIDPAEKQRLAKQRGLTEEDIERLFNQQWRRPGSVPAAVTSPLKEPTKAPTLNVQMPDITGTWGPYLRYEVIIRRAKNGEADFEMTTRLLKRFKAQDPYREDPPQRRIKWFPEAQHFQTLDPRNQGIATLTMKPNADGKSMHVTVTINGKPVNEPFVNDAGEMEWVRGDAVATPEEPGGAVMPGGLGRSGDGLRRTDLAPQIHAIPDTPAAKQLVEQLHAQESAAAAEAATIRQLQANGQAEQNQQPIAEHQRKFKNLLSTAFDLKLQLEELQVKELQSRLSRLERQIGHRKELREKIITRRAGELIEGETLRWSPSAPLITRENESGVSERGSLLGMPPTSRQPSGASPPPTGMGTRGLNPLGSMPQPAVPPKGLEFLSQYPRFSSLSLDMTETQFRAFLEQQKLVPQLSIPQDGQLNYSVPLGDGNRLTVMFGLDGKCRGIEPISGAAPSPILPHPASPAPVRAEKVVAKIFRLEQVDAASVAKTLQELASEKPFSARISADAASNSVIVFANPDDMRVIEAIVIRLDKAPDPPSPKAAPKPGSDSSATPAIPGTSKADGKAASLDPLELRDQIVIDLYGGSQVLPGLGKNPGYSKLIQSLNALKGVTTNFREAGKGDAIVMAMIHDPSQRCQREAQQTLKESELRVAINSALKAAGIQSVRWEENTATAEVEKVEGNSASTPKADQIVIDLYGGSGVLWGLSKNPNHSKLIQSLNALSGVVTNFRIADEGTAIAIAIVRDPSQRCLRETQRTQKESELRVAINSALKAAGIEATRWDEDSDAESAEKSAPAE